MRPWICMLALGAVVTAASTLPAAANNMTPRSPAVVRNSPVEPPFLRHGFFRHDRLRGPFAFGGPLFFPGGFFGGDLMSGAASGAPTVVMLSDPPAASPLPRRSADDARPSVETAAEGVVIVRGPGSRHLGR